MKRIFIGMICLCTTMYTQAQNIDVNLINKGLTAYNPNFDTGSARYIGMGESMGALGNDVSAINTNPAASGVFIKSNASLSLNLNDATNKATLGTSLSNSEQNFNISQVGGVINIPIENSDWKFVNIGLLYDNQTLDNRVNYAGNSNLSFFDYDADGNAVDQYGFDGYVQKTTGSKQKFTINLGANYNNNLYVGANLNLHSVNLTNENVLFGEFTGNTTPEKVTYGAWDTPYNENSSGVSVGVGVIGKLTHEIRVGASYQSPIKWSQISTEYNAYVYNETTGLAETYTDVGFFDQDQARSAGKLALSAGFVLGKNFALNVDYLRHFHGNLEFQAGDNSNIYDDTNNFISQDGLKASNEYRIGGEYRYKKWRFRAGGSMSDSPVESFTPSYWVDGNNQTQTSSISDLLVGKKEKYSVGLGYDFGNFAIDFAYQNINHDYKSLLYGTHVDPGFYLAEVENYSPNVNNTQNNYVLSLNWSF